VKQTSKESDRGKSGRSGRTTLPLRKCGRNPEGVVVAGQGPGPGHDRGEQERRGETIVYQIIASASK